MRLCRPAGTNQNSYDYENRESSVNRAPLVSIPEWIDWHNVLIATKFDSFVVVPNILKYYCCQLCMNKMYRTIW